MSRLHLKGISVLSAGLLLAAESIGSAQETSDDSHQENALDAEPPGTSAPEEIIIYGDQTLMSLQREVYRAEEAFFDAFKAINSDDEYDITCKRKAPTGSHIKRRVCEPRFVPDAHTMYAEAWLNGWPLPSK